MKVAESLAGEAHERQREGAAKGGSAYSPKIGSLPSIDGKLPEDEASTPKTRKRGGANEIAAALTRVSPMTISRLGSLKRAGRVGNALIAIRDNHWYEGRDEYPDFDAYCKVRWNFGKSYHNRLIAGAKVMVVLTPMGVAAPATERQARELAPLLDKPEVMVEAWTEATEDAAKVVSVVEATNRGSLPSPGLRGGDPHGPRATNRA